MIRSSAKTTMGFTVKSEVTQINFIVLPYKSHALTSFAILVFHVMSMRDDYLNNNIHRSFRDWLLASILVMGQP